MFRNVVTCMRCGNVIAGDKFGKAARRVLTADGAEVEDIRALRDGDHLFLC